MTTTKQARRKTRRQNRKRVEQILLTSYVEEPEPKTLGFTHACGFCGKHFMPWDLPEDWETHMVACRKLGYGSGVSPEALAAFAAGNKVEIAAARAEKRRKRQVRKAKRKAARIHTAAIEG